MKNRTGTAPTAVDALEMHTTEDTFPLPTVVLGDREDRLELKSLN